MQTLSLPTEEEIRAAARQGEDAVVALVVGMMSNWVEAMQQQQEIIHLLEERVQALEDQLAKNSSNSGKPPSSDGFKRPGHGSLRQSGGKKSGGQPGHKGYTLEMKADPKHIQVHRVEHCHRCRSNLEHVPARGHERRQVIDLPPVQVEVTEHQAEIKDCPYCGKMNKAEFPSGVNQPVQYGSRLKAQMVYFNQYHFVSLDRVSEIFSDLYNQPVSEGTIVEACLKTAEQVVVVNQDVKQHLSEEEIVTHHDETEARVEGKLHWLHSTSAERLTYYEIHPRRGRKALWTPLGFCPNAKGRSCMMTILPTSVTRMSFMLCATPIICVN